MSGTTNTKDTKRNLPPGWRWARLGEVVNKAQAGFACGRRDELGIVQVRMQNINTVGCFVWDNLVRIPGADIPNENSLLQPNDVLFNNTNSTELVGKSALFEGYAEPVVFSNHFTRLSPDLSQLDPSYLAKWLVQLWQQGTFAAICNRWIGQSAIKNDKLLQLEIPLPPLPEQRRIAAILKEQMAAVDKARAAAEARLDAVKALPAAFRNQIFPRHDQKLAAGWKRKALGTVLEISSGQVDPKDARYKDLPHVNGENIESGTGRLLNVRSAAEDNMTSGKYLFKPGVVLYSKLRPYLMKVAVAHFRGLCSADMYPLTPHPEEMTLEFLQQLLLSEAFTNYAVAESQRARMPKLNREQLMAYAAPLPPFADQSHLAARLREQMDAAEKARAAAEAELAAINALPAALLRRAFNGEL